jgi:hypothetical protein
MIYLILRGSDTVVQIMHQTVREFLLDQNGPITRSRFKEIIKVDVQAWITEICIHYKDISTTHKPYLRDSYLYTPAERSERRPQTPRERNEVERWNERESNTIPPEHGATHRLNTREMEHHVRSANPRQKRTTTPIQTRRLWDSRLLEGYAAYLNDRPLVGYVAYHLQNQKVAPNQQLDDLETLTPIPTRFNNQQNGDRNAVHELAIQVNNYVFKERDPSRLIDVHHKFLNGCLWFSAHFGFHDAARILLSTGALVDTKNYHHSTHNRAITPLLSAAKNGHVLIVQLLLNHNVDIHYETGQRR